jgi:hypothetical protein
MNIKDISTKANQRKPWKRDEHQRRTARAVRGLRKALNAGRREPSVDPIYLNMLNHHLEGIEHALSWIFPVEGRSMATLSPELWAEGEDQSPKNQLQEESGGNLEP